MAAVTSKRRKAPKHPPVSLKDKPSDAHRNGWIVPIILIIAAVAAFFPVLGHDFTTWDDYSNVARNPRLNPATVDGVLYFWSHPHMAIYIPLTYTVWGGLATIAHVDMPDEFGITLNPSIFHGANLLIHIVAALFAYQLLKTLVGRRGPAAVGSLLFLLHPVQVEPVAWVAGLKDVLCGMLSLLALWQYVVFAKASESESPPTASRLAYVAATAAFILALLAKPSATTVPLCAAMIDRFLVGRSWKRIGIALLPWLILAAGCAVVAKTAQPVELPPDGGRLWARPLLAGAAIAFYLFKLIYPRWLAVQYHYSPMVLMAGKWIWFGWIIPATIATAVWLGRKRRPWLVAAGGIFVAATLPVLGLVPFQFERLSLVADHYLYVAMLGPAIVVAYWLSVAKGPRRKIGFALSAIVLVMLGIRTHLQTRYWRDTVTLFDHELAVNPFSEAGFNSLAAYDMKFEHPQVDEQLARKSIRVQPEQEEAYVTLAGALFAEHRVDEAIAMYRFALKNDPTNPIILNDLALALAPHEAPGASTRPDEAARLDEAIRLCRRSLEINNESASTHRNLAVMLSRQGNMAEALRESEKAMQLDPNDAEAHTNLGFLLYFSGRKQEAAGQFNEALRLDPTSAKARQGMALFSAPTR
jgi:tetratricopeptide (TPR) repeat protein